jgi:hypothetical protein
MEKQMSQIRKLIITKSDKVIAIVDYNEILHMYTFEDNKKLIVTFKQDTSKYVEIDDLTEPDIKAVFDQVIQIENEL